MLDRHPAHLAGVGLGAERPALTPTRAAAPPLLGGSARARASLLLYKHPAFCDNPPHPQETAHGRTRQSPQHRKSQGPAGRAGADRKAVRQGLDHAPGRRRGRSRTSRSSPPARSASTSRSASAACRAAAWSRSTARSRRGKTTLTLQVIAEMQKLGGTCAFIDAEHALDIAVRAEARRQPAGAADLASPTPASRRSRSSTRWCARARSTWSSSTRSPRSRPRPRSKARWAIRCPACRRA